MLFCELKKKEVISLKTCNRIGYVTDLEFDHCTGCIKKIIVSDRNKWIPSLCCDNECYICYSDIKQIGPDIIIVDL